MSSRPNFALAGEDPQHFGVEAALTYIWDVPTLSWVKSTGGGGGGGGAVTVADGADVAQGTTTDAAWVAGAGTVISLLKKIASAGGSAVSIADGSDVAEGATTDAAVVTDTTGTLSGKLRGLVKHAFERMPAALGQTTMAASLPVTLASNQSAVPVSGPLTDAQLRATPVPVSGTVTASGPLTDAQLRASAVPVSGTVAVTSAGLTNLDVALSTRLKSADTLTGVTTVGTVTTITNPVAVTGPLTDAQLRASAVPVTGSFSASTAADVFAADGDSGYVNGDMAKDLTQTDDGRLRVVAAGLISDVPNPYLDGDVRSLSMTNDGRLRVSTTPARLSVPFFSEDEEGMWKDHQVEYAHTGSPWTTW